MTPAQKAATTRAENKARRERETADAARREHLATKVYDAYDKPGRFGNALWIHDRPSYGYSVNLERWKVTVEYVHEDVEVIRDRLVKLWREDERNHHHQEPMWRAAMQYLGMTSEEARALLTAETHGIDNPKYGRDE